MIFQTNGKDRSSSNDFQEDNSLSTLKSLIKAYKEAIFVGDEKTIYEIEDMLFMVDKENKELVERISALSVEISSGKEKYIRLQADFDNYRKRAENEKLTVRSNAQGEVIESLLPMVDSFERAKQQIKLETEKEKKIDTSYQGIYKQFVEIMRSLRVTAVPTVGKPFDPSVRLKYPSFSFLFDDVCSSFCAIHELVCLWTAKNLNTHFCVSLVFLFKIYNWLLDLSANPIEITCQKK